MSNTNNKGKGKAEELGGWEEDEGFGPTQELQKPPPGKLYPLPHPLVPVTAANPNQNKKKDKVPEVFKTLSEVSSQKFDAFAKVASKLWFTDTDVPVEWVKSEKYNNTSNDKGHIDFNPKWDKDDFMETFTFMKLEKEDTISECSDPSSFEADECGINQHQLVAGESLYWSNPDGSANPLPEKSRCPKRYCMPAKYNYAIVNIIEEKDQNYEEEAQAAKLLCSILKSPQDQWLRSFHNDVELIIGCYTRYKWETIECFFKLLASPEILLGKYSTFRPVAKIISKIYSKRGWSGKTIGYLRNYVDSPQKIFPIIRSYEAMCRIKNECGLLIPLVEITNALYSLKSQPTKEVTLLINSIQKIQASSERLLPFDARLLNQPPLAEWMIIIREKMQKERPKFHELFNSKFELISPPVYDLDWSKDMEDIYHYLHYHYLCAELIQPIQDAASQWRTTPFEKSTSPMGPHVYYQGVKFKYANVDSSGRLILKMSFRPNYPHLDWTRGENLWPGSFVVLFLIYSQDKNSKKSIDLSTMITGTVEHYNFAELIPTKIADSIIGLNFTLDQLEKLDLKREYIMFSSNVHFPSIKQNIDWINERSLAPRYPLAKEILICPRIGTAPEYLEGASINLAKIMPLNRSNTIVPIFDWPDYNHKRYIIDAEYFRALQNIFRHKISVTLTPLGTPQVEFVSNAINLIYQCYQNRRLHEPILLITRTADALNEILESVIEFIPNLVRIGPPQNVPESLKGCQVNALAGQNIRKSQIHRDLREAKKNINKYKDHLENLFRIREIIFTDESFVNNSPTDIREQFLRGRKNNNDMNEEIIQPIYRKWISDGAQESLDHEVTITAPSTTAYNKGPIYEMCNMSSFQERIINKEFDDEDSDVVDRSHQTSLELPHLLPSDISRTVNQMWRNTGGEFNAGDDVDIWKLDSSRRKRNRERYQRIVTDYILNDIKHTMQELSSLEKQLEYIRELRWGEITRYSPLIGMTIHYASTHLNLIQTLSPRVCIVNEACEIPEAVLAPCLSSPRLEHLLMISDFIRYGPTPQSDIAAQFGTHISFFERWLRRNGSYYSLSTNTLIRPEIYNALRGYYHSPLGSTIKSSIINDHQDLRNLKNVLGMAYNIQFMTHENYDKEYEALCQDLHFHHEPLAFNGKNPFEAEFSAHLALYLSQQDNFVCQNTTILTPYVQQKTLILQKLDPCLKSDVIEAKKNEWGIKEEVKIGKVQVKTIEEYVGKQAEIVILSLSSPSPRFQKEWLEFIGLETLVKLAISRAKYGLYIIGNGDILMQSESWRMVLNGLKEQGHYGDSISILCQRHGFRKLPRKCLTDPQKFDMLVNKIRKVKSASDFELYTPDGGCSVECDSRLFCGHRCPSKCHPIKHGNELRQKFICKKPCARRRPQMCIHPCSRQCFECQEIGECEACKAVIVVTLPCGHSKDFICSEIPQDISSVPCNALVEITNSCGHKTTISCDGKSQT
ncbi:hypothetical protein G9A89_007869 [Geosiphon pyriformis]|nr:hypothetical protein G9A89_007869 [Geosiphon pyriformis]